MNTQTYPKLVLSIDPDKRCFSWFRNTLDESIPGYSIVGSTRELIQVLNSRVLPTSMPIVVVADTEDIYALLPHKHLMERYQLVLIVRDDNMFAARVGHQLRPAMILNCNQVSTELENVLNRMFIHSQAMSLLPN